MHMVWIRPSSWPWEVQGPSFNRAPPLWTIRVRAPSVDLETCLKWGPRKYRDWRKGPETNSIGERHENCHIFASKYAKSGHRYANAGITRVLHPARLGPRA